MKHQYVFLRDVENVNHDSVIFHVWVGSHERDLENLQFVSQYAAAHDDWFEKWAEHVDYRIDYYEERAFWNAPVAARRFRSTSISIGRLAQLIRNGNLVAFESSVAISSMFCKIMWMCYPSIPFYDKSSGKHSHLPTSSRKYLSLLKESDAIKAAKRFGIIAMLFVLQMILDAVERAWL